MICSSAWKWTADAEYRLATSSVAPPAIPRPVLKIVGPDELQGAYLRAADPDGECEMDVRMVDLDDFEEKLALIVDVHGRP